MGIDQDNLLHHTLMVMMVSTCSLDLKAANKNDQENLLKPHPDGYVGLSKVNPDLHSQVGYNFEVRYQPAEATRCHQQSDTCPTTPMTTKGKNPLLN
jgi:hypothetical protein